MTEPRPETLTYKDAGIDLGAGRDAADQFNHLCQRTYGPRVLRKFGGFAGMLRLDFNEKIFARNYKDPVLAACTSGVGTKLKIAAQLRKYDTVGIDLVAMSVNDLIVQGAEPLFFLDYLALHRHDAAMTTTLVKGVSDACLDCRCALLSGETAEMPTLYAPGEFDLAGFAVGVVERRKIPAGNAIEIGDSVIGLASAGLHAHGFALVRRVIDKLHVPLDEFIPELGCTLAEELLRPSRIYANAITALLARYKVKRIVKAMSHITGSGLPGKLPRGLPEGLGVRIKRDSWPVPPIFTWLQKHGPIDIEEMYHVFNMGIGYGLIVRPTFTKAIMTHLRTLGEKPYFLGKVKKAAGEPALEWA